jgi:protein-S-isoprenylcysteine O-methyltransferase Ste14
VVGGVFRIVRNPVYTALGIMALGLTLLVPNAIALAGLAMLIIGAQLKVRLIEEPYLHKVHGSQYVDYISKVGRFLPGRGLQQHRWPAMRRRIPLHGWILIPRPAVQ